MNKFSFSTLLEGERIILKKHDENLAQTMFEYVDKDRERLNQFLPWVPFVKNVTDELKYIQQTHQDWQSCLRFDYGIFNKFDHTYLGNIGVHTIEWNHKHCEIGYWILGQFEGQSYMSEAVRTLEKYLFENGFHRIEIRCSSVNNKSANVPIACGYLFEGELEENSIEHQKYRNTKIFSKLKSRYLNANIVVMRDSDLYSVIKIAKSLPQFFTPKGVESIMTDFHTQRGIVYRLNDKVVGFLMYYSNQAVAEIGWMGVLPEYQGQGVGKQLIAHLKKILVDIRCTSLIVKTLDESVDYKPYEKTRAFYLKNGFIKSQVLLHPENPECEAELVLKAVLG